MILAELNPNKNRVKTELEPCEDWYDVPSDEMTLEQARQAVKDLRKKLSEYLEQEPCEDCISRQEALNCVTLNEFRYKIVEDMKTLPSVAPKEKTGHWVKTPKAVMGEGYMWYCDKCEHQVYQDSSRDYPSEKYCPNCGARMVSE